MDLELDGRTAVVTGASRGIGLAAARKLTAEGVKLLLVARDGNALEAVRTELLSAGAPQASTLAIDMSEPASEIKIVNHAISELGKIDLLVSSAGDTRRGDIYTVQDEDFQHSFAVKFHATVRLIRGTAEHMREAQSGRMVIVAGSSGREPDPQSLPVGAVNAALMAVIRAAAVDLAPNGITITAVNPGAVDTERFQRRVDRLTELSTRSKTEIANEIAATSPMGRIATPEEIGDWITFLCSPKSQFVTGEAITIDGGTRRGI